MAPAVSAGDRKAAGAVCAFVIIASDAPPAQQIPDELHKKC